MSVYTHLELSLFYPSDHKIVFVTTVDGYPAVAVWCEDKLPTIHYGYLSLSGQAWTLYASTCNSGNLAPASESLIALLGFGEADRDMISYSHLEIPDDPSFNEIPMVALVGGMPALVCWDCVKDVIYYGLIWLDGDALVEDITDEFSVTPALDDLLEALGF